MVAEAVAESEMEKKRPQNRSTPTAMAVSMAAMVAVWPLGICQKDLYFKKVFNLELKIP